MVFTREPLVPPGSQTLTFDSPAIPSATFQENNGAAEIAVSGPVPLFASFSNDGRTITITPAPQATAHVPAPAAQPAVPAPAGSPAPQVSPGAAAAVASTAVQYFVVVDASHGGDERGAALSDQLAEKDVTLAFALRLRQQLQARGLTTLMLREGDTTMSLDQRANMTNAAHPAIYVCLHAASQGSGVRLYTALLRPEPRAGDHSLTGTRLSQDSPPPVRPPKPALHPNWQKAGCGALPAGASAPFEQHHYGRRGHRGRTPRQARRA